MSAPFKVTPLHRWHVTHGARLAFDSGWQRPITYGDPDGELAACQSGIGICDLSMITKIDVQGRATEKVLAALTAGDVPPPCGCMPLKAPPPNSLAVRLAWDQSMILGNSEDRSILLDRFASAVVPESCIHVTDMTSAYVAIYLVGPSAAQLLKCMTAAPVEAMREHTCCLTSTARVWSLLVRLPSHIAPAWLVFVSRDYGEYVWESYVKVGKQFQVRPFGTTVERELRRRGASDVATV